MHDQGRSDFLRNVTVSRETLAKLDNYATMLEGWQRKINLVGPKTIAELWVRHFWDSAQLYPHVAGARRLADLGSGAGFPGLVLAVMGMPDVHLVDSDQRKGIFLREVSRETSAPVTVHTGRAEQIAPIMADVVTARAFAPLVELLPMAYRHIKPDGRFVLLKGEGWASEVEAARRAGWVFHVKHLPSQTAPEAAILILSDLKPPQA